MKPDQLILNDLKCNIQRSENRSESGIAYLVAANYPAAHNSRLAEALNILTDFEKKSQHLQDLNFQHPDIPSHLILLI